MKWIVLAACIAFWLAMAAVWSFAGWAPALAPGAALDVAAAARAPSYGPDQVAEHGNATSCWMIIAGRIYDLTAYIDLHPANPESVLKYCGKDGSRGFETKDRNRPHSAEARKLLERYLIGTLEEE